MCSQCVAKAKSASVCFQVVLLSCSLLILCKDHRTAFSYFYEAFEAYHQTSSTAKAWLDTVDTVDTSLSSTSSWIAAVHVLMESHGGQNSDEVHASFEDYVQPAKGQLQGSPGITFWYELVIYGPLRKRTPSSAASLVLILGKLRLERKSRVPWVLWVPSCFFTTLASVRCLQPPVRCSCEFFRETHSDVCLDHTRVVPFLSFFHVWHSAGLQYVGPEIDAMAAVASAHEARRDRDVMHCGLVTTNSSRMSQE